jgi:hypothetical protein
VLGFKLAIPLKQRPVVHCAIIGSALRNKLLTISWKSDFLVFVFVVGFAKAPV